MNLLAQHPTMQAWTDAWHHANPDALKRIYATAAVLFPPNKPMVSGNDAIIAFMQGGLGKLDVFFTPESQIVASHLAFEYGTFKDVELDTQIVVGQGKYTVTWTYEGGGWKILSHTWSMAEGN